MPPARGGHPSPSPDLTAPTNGLRFLAMASPSLTRISRAGFVNAYLVREDDGLTLVDTMLKGSGKRIVAAADRLGAPIVRILLTHAHGDHIGSLDQLAALLPDAQGLISSREARPLRKDKSLDPREPPG